MSNKKQLLDVLLKNYKPKKLNEIVVDKIKIKWADDLNGFSYIPDPDVITINNIIRYFTLDLKKISDIYYVSNIEFNMNKSIKYIKLTHQTTRTTFMMAPEKYYIFRYKKNHDK